MKVSGTYFDGQTAKSHGVEIIENGTSLTFSGPTIAITSWTLSGLHPIDAPTSGQPFRLTHDSKPGARLIVFDADFIAQIIRANRNLKGGYSGRDIRQLLGWTAAGIAGLAALCWLAFAALPGPIAHLTPQKWRERTGAETEASLTKSYDRCEGAIVEKAFGQILANFSEGTSDIPTVSIRVYALPMVNAFAVNGGHIIFTRQLIAKADGPDEVAGVLAHEMGHVALLHPEEQMVRLVGMDVISGLFGGGSNVGSEALLVAGLMRHSRTSEAAADAYAQDVLTKARVDTKGFKSFFEKIQKLENGAPSGNAAVEALGNIFSTHPGTEDRIKNVKPLAAGVVARPSMDDETWKAFKAACG